MKKHKWSRSAGALLLGLLVASLVWQAPAGAQSKAAAAPVEKALGSKSAPITMEVFSDYQCPHCRDFYLQTVKPLIDNYVLTGKVYLIHRDMPLPTNPYSRRAARYANAAAQVKQLEKVMDVLYSKQLLWSADGDVDRVVAEVLTPAEMHQVRQLVQSGKLDAAIESDMARGRAYRVRQTPTIIVTHRGESVSIESAVSYTLLRRYLDDLLKK